MMKLTGVIHTPIPSITGYRSKPTQSIDDYLSVELLVLAKDRAKGFSGGDVEKYAEFISAGLIGATNVLNTWNPLKTASIRTYAYGVLRNQYYDVLRIYQRKWSQMNRQGDEIEESMLFASMDDTERVVIIRNFINTYLQELDKIDIHIFYTRLYTVSEISLQEIADKFGISRQAIAKREGKLIGTIRSIWNETD